MTRACPASSPSACVAKGTRQKRRPTAMRGCGSRDRGNSTWGVAASGRRGWAAFDLAGVDVMLPGLDGLHVASTLRDRGVTTPILMLTARDTVDDRVAGLRAGADDY